MDKLQKEIDVKKWIESEIVNYDLCGSYPYCKYCNKDIPNPCSSAIKKMNNIDSNKQRNNKKENKGKSKYKRLTFQEKLDRQEIETKNDFNDVVNIIESIKLIPVINKRFLSIKYKNHLCGWISLNRNLLKIHLPIDNNSNLEYKPIDYSYMKTYMKNPYTLSLSLSRSKKAIKVLLLQIVDSIDNKYYQNSI